MTSRVLNAVGVLGATLLVASIFPPSLMFSNTTAAGGDLGSHNYAAAMARDLLLREHRLTGWIPGNFCGFPLFQMYFPVPFVVSTLASLIVVPHVAFKLMSVLGVLLLPAAAFFCLSCRRVPFPGPALGACLTVPFLFQAGNSAWGGNLQSTMAGEFAYSISLPLALVYIGIEPRLFRSIRWAVAAAVVIALLAMTHAYTVLWIALAAVLAVPFCRQVGAAAFRTGLVFILGGALCAFWLLPLLWYSPWTTAFKHLWLIGSVKEVAPAPLWPAIAASVLGPLLLAWTDRERLAEYMRATEFLWAAMAAAVLAYVAAPNFGVVDVRFLPFAQLTVSLLGAAGAGCVLLRWPAPGLWIPIAIVGVAALTQQESRHIQSWVRWNYEGFERKPAWPVFSGIAAHLRGSAADPRVAYEHSPDNEVLGTIRAFENLPLFSGRSTLEGVNFQASVTAPFVFYVQSEISQVMSCPFAEWGCSRPNLESGLEHLVMMNVSHLILRSEAMQQTAAQQPALRRTGSFGPYGVYRLEGARPGYVQPLAVRPYFVVTTDWKSDAYRWFKQARRTDAVPLFISETTATGGPHNLAVAGTFARLPAKSDVPLVPLAGAVLDETVEPERIRIRGARPGQPLLVRVSYHPRWRSTTGEPVWLAGPGFMVVFPGGSELELVYASGAPVALGQAMTLGGAGLVLLLVVWNPRPARRPEAALAFIEVGRSRRPLVPVILCVLCGVIASASGIRARQSNADATYLRGQVALDRSDIAGAQELFQRARMRAPLSNTAIHATYFEGVALYRAKQWSQARRAFRLLVDRFPEAQAAAESLYHVGLCAEHLGETAEAMSTYEATERQFPGTPWADYAAARRAALRGA